jgi:hypothetical protein
MISLRAATALATILNFAPVMARANDGAAETAAGGIRLREERRVAMTKERLKISKIKGARRASGIPDDHFRVTVEYEFLADSHGPDVATEVAFPLPEYGYGYDDLAGTRRVGHFKVEVDGKSIDVQKEVRAYAGGRDVTAELRGANLDPETFGGFARDPKAAAYGVTHLSPAKRDSLIALGALNPASEGDEFGLGPNWSVAVTYYWRQIFPAGKVVKIRHEYDAVAGLAYVGVAEDLPKYFPGPAGCFDPSLLKALDDAQRRVGQGGAQRPLIQFNWVSYVLTTANTWKTPISDFALDIEHPEGERVSLCWDGSVERLSKTRFRAIKRDFLPTKELTVYFLYVEREPQ